MARRKLLYSALLSALLELSSFAATRPQGWDYQYGVEAPGTRSESVHGKLLYRGEEMPALYEHVVTPIGEFVFRNIRAINAAEKIGWVPVSILDGRIRPAQSKREVDRLLEGKDPSCRRTIDYIKPAVSAVVLESKVEGTLEKPPIQVGANWFYAVNRQLWINPEPVKQLTPTPSRADSPLIKP